MGADNKPAEEEIRRPEEARVVIVNSDSDSDVSDDDQVPAGYERIPSDPDEDEEEVEVVFEDEKVEKEGDDKKEDEVDIEQVKNAMAGMILPPSSVPKWGAMLSDSDFINAVRETIKPKLDHAQQQKTKKPAESKKT